MLLGRQERVDAADAAGTLTEAQHNATNTMPPSHSHVPTLSPATVPATAAPPWVPVVLRQ